MSSPISSTKIATTTENWRTSRVQAAQGGNWRSPTNSPPTKGHMAKTWRTGSRSPSPTNSGSSPSRRRVLENPTAGTVRVGQIVWLPDFDRIDASSVCKTTQAHAGSYNHPVLVVEDDMPGGHVKVMIITTLGSTPIKEKFKRQWRYLEAHLLIQHSNNTHGQFDNPASKTALEMAHGSKELERASYLRVDQEIEIEASNLRWMPLNGQRTDEIYISLESMHYLRRLSKPAPLYNNAPVMSKPAPPIAPAFPPIASFGGMVSTGDLVRLRKQAAQKKSTGPILEMKTWAMTAAAN